MMQCPRCSTENPEDAKFCKECAHKLVLGTEGIRTHLTPEPERKHVTALFCDLTGYTAMTEKLDPEEVKAITGRVFGEVKQVITKYEGFIERVIGDGVLAFFGVPRAHEDDPIRAIHAAREIHDLVKSLSPQYETRIGAPLSMHSGINTGLVVTADVDEKSGTHGVAGDAINVASRLSDLAKPNEILVGQDTHARAENGFSFEDLGLKKVKGKADPIRIYKMLAPKAKRAGIRLDRQVSSEMVGRDQDLAKLELQVLKAVNGEGSVVNVIGEAGIGKSRLIAELKKRDVMKRVTLLEGRAISIGKNLSFHPIIDLLKQWAEIAEDDTETRAFDKLEKAIRVVHPDETNEILPFIATLMGMKLRGRHAERVKGIEGEGLEKLILKNVRELLIKGSELRPTVVVMEDIHWADTSSIELLGSLYRLAEKYRIAFINVFRPGYFDSDDGAVAKVGERLPVYYVGIDIQPLDKTDSETLINNMLEIKGLPYSLKTQIVERAGGNPFFIEEVVRSLIDEGAVVRRDGGFGVTDRIDSVVIPPTINDVLMARIDRLEEQTRELVKVASVIGRSFFDRIIKDVADSISDVDDRLAYLKDVQIIRDRIRMQELEYLFKHALAQEAAYESTLMQQRKALHLKVAQSIERLFQDRLHEFYGMLAYHYGKGEDLDKAEEYITRAGEEALRSSASSEALAYFQRALRLYEDKHGIAADPEKLTHFEKNIALAFYQKGYFANAIKYFDRISERLGVGLPNNKILIAVIAIWYLTIILSDLYFPSNKAKQNPDIKDIEMFDLSFMKGQGLVYVDSKRGIVEGLAIMRKYTGFDLNKLPNACLPYLVMSGAFSLTGISFNVSAKYLQRGKGLIHKTIPTHLTAYYCFDTSHKMCSGAWDKIEPYDELSVNLALRNGEMWYTLNYILFYAFIKADQGEFEFVINLIDKLFEIAEAYDNEHANRLAHSVQARLSIKMRQRLNKGKIAADRAVSHAAHIGVATAQIMNLGYRLTIQMLLNDPAGAEESSSQAKALMQKQDTVFCFQLAPCLVGQLLMDRHLMKAAIASGSSSDLAKACKNACQTGKAALRTTRKIALHRIELLSLLGVNHWLINKQGKAMKWWDKAIKEGERLGARPDLSRTYFEVGKHLLKPESKYKHLNGIDANGYLEKAGILFEEMGLERDLEDLERVRMEL